MMDATSNGKRKLWVRFKNSRPTEVEVSDSDLHVDHLKKRLKGLFPRHLSHIEAFEFCIKQHESDSEAIPEDTILDQLRPINAASSPLIIDAPEPHSKYLTVSPWLSGCSDRGYTSPHTDPSVCGKRARTSFLGTMRNAGGRMNAELAQEDTVWSPNMLIPAIHAGIGEDPPSMGRMTTSGFHLGLKGSDFDDDQDATTATTTNTMSTPTTTRSRSRNELETLSGGGGASSGGGLGISSMPHSSTPVTIVTGGGSGGCGGGSGGCGGSGSCVGGGCSLSDGGVGTASVSGRGNLGVSCVGVHDGLGNIGLGVGGGLRGKKAADGLSKGHAVILYSRGHDVARGKIISCERNGQCKIKLRTWNGDGLTLTADGKPLREIGQGGEILWLRSDVRRDPHRPMTDGASSIG